jgi:hypothetical protein
MKHLFYICLILLYSGLSFGQKSDLYLTNGATTIKNETTPKANTANRIGTILQDIIDSKISGQDWATSTLYTINRSFVIQSNVLYKCIVTHTSGTFSTDLAASKWQAISNAGSGGGLQDPGSNGLLKRTGLNTTAPAVAGTDYVLPAGVTKAAVGLPLAENTTDLGKPISTATQTALDGKQPLDADLTSIAAASTAGVYGRNSSGNWVSIIFGSGVNFNTSTMTLTGTGGGGGSAVVAYTTTAFASTVNVDFSGNNVDFTNVTGNFTVTGSSLTSGGFRSLLIHKNTASPVVISIDQTTLAAPSIKSLTNTAQYTAGAPPTVTLNGGSGSLYIIYLMIQGASGSFIPDIQVSQLGSENAINVTANYNTIGVDHTMHTATATTVEQIMAQIPLPANTLPANSYLVIEYVAATAFSGNAGNVQGKVRIGPPGLTNANISTAPTIDDLNNSNSGAIRRRAWLNVINSTTQTVQIGYTEANHPIPITRNFNLATDLVIYFTQEKQSNAADVASLGLIRVEAGNK